MIDGGVFIDNQSAPAAGAEEFDVHAPADGRVLGRAARGTPADIDRGVAAARKAFDSWNQMAPREREAALLRIADALDTEGEARLLDLIIDESGSTITKARGEIAYGADLMRAAAGEARRLYGETFPNDRPDRTSMVFREAIGVAGILSPYNAPLALLIKMTAFPLAAGNTLVVKPSEETPLTALAFAQLAADAGLPPGVMNVVPGFGAECGQALTSHPDVDVLALTGATETGRKVGATAMQSMRHVQLELGGKNPLLVLEDADPVAAAAIAAQGIFSHAGQICMANSRIIVDRKIAGAFRSALKDAANALPIGPLREPGTVYGPLINQAAVDKIAGQQAEANKAGASLLCGGKVRDGLVYEPTILENVPRDCALWREESFGPIACLVEVDGLDAAIAAANDTQYGLSAGVLTHNVQWGFQAARRIRAGSVHIGMHPFQSNAMAPIGGYGLSGLGRSGGQYSTQEFTEVKWVSVEVGGDAP